MWARDHTLLEAKSGWSCQGCPGLVPGREDKGHQGDAGRTPGRADFRAVRWGGGGSRSQDKAAAARTAPPRGPARPRRTRPASEHASESTRADDAFDLGKAPVEKT
ncbi:unnamed protein product [Rangifer tarandus platyrhynchus]|uniref:Uncharacterized protein n=1 Tax=Rangifer tarandus platyrhynchus TaxID=3082113 RepID=A0ABN9A1X8_RANTA|nr:unnamed protein product [Rangifer tarandus platyrhynchus]